MKKWVMLDEETVVGGEVVIGERKLHVLRVRRHAGSKVEETEEQNATQQHTTKQHTTQQHTTQQRTTQQHTTQQHAVLFQENGNTSVVFLVLAIKR